MNSITSHKGLLKIVGRMPSSAFGNPRYTVRIDGFTCVTGVDSTHGYSVPNFDGRDVSATIGTHYGIATLRTVNEL